MDEIGFNSGEELILAFKFNVFWTYNIPELIHFFKLIDTNNYLIFNLHHDRYIVLQM